MSKKKQRTEEEAKADAQRKKYLDICPAFGRDEDGDTAIDDSTAECEQCGKQDKAMHDACAAECAEGAPKAPAAAEPTEAPETAAPDAEEPASDAETTDDTPDETEAPEAPAEKAAEVAEAPPETEAEEAPETPEANTEVSDAPDAPEEAETATSDAEEPAAAEEGPHAPDADIPPDDHVTEEPKTKVSLTAFLTSRIMKAEQGHKFTIKGLTATTLTETEANTNTIKVAVNLCTGYAVRYNILDRVAPGHYVRV